MIISPSETIETIETVQEATMMNLDTEAILEEDQDQGQGHWIKCHHETIDHITEIWGRSAL